MWLRSLKTTPTRLLQKKCFSCHAFRSLCGHCKTMAEKPKYVTIELEGQAVLAGVDDTFEEDLARKQRTLAPNT